MFQVSNYRNITSSGDEGATYCCCSWKRLPRALKWAIIGCTVVILASFIATLYIFTKHGADGFSPHGSGILALTMGPGLVLIAVVGIVMSVMCHELRVKRQLREDQARLNLSQNGLNLYNIGNANRI